MKKSFQAGFKEGGGGFETGSATESGGPIFIQMPHAHILSQKLYFSKYLHVRVAVLKFVRIWIPRRSAKHPENRDKRLNVYGNSRD